MFKLKPLNPGAVSAALQKVERYRLLNEPHDAESICRDVLAIDADNQAALINLILSLTDQFPEGLAGRFDEAKEVASRLKGDFERAYYTGIVCERRAKTHYAGGNPSSGETTYDWLRQAMEWYEQAEALQPEGNNDSVLRWNTCARLIMGHEIIKPTEDIRSPMQLE